MRIADAVDEYLGAKQNLAHDTVAWYTYHLDYFTTWCEAHQITELSQITPAIVQKAVSEHPRTNTNTRHGLVQVVKGWLNYCAEDEEMGVRAKLVKRIDLPKAVQPDIKILTDEELMKLMRACDKLRQPHRNRAILHILIDCGVRASELAYDSTRPEEDTGLLLENVVIGRGDESYIRVIGKGKKIRPIRIGVETKLAIQKYLHRERGHSDCPYLFLAPRYDEPLSVRMLQQLLKKLGDIAGVEGVHPHRFRHTFGVNQTLAGTSPFILMQVMGHTSLEATRIYTRGVSQMQARNAAPSMVDQMKKRRHTK